MQSVCAHCYRRLDLRRRQDLSLLCSPCEHVWLQGMKPRAVKGTEGSAKHSGDQVRSPAQAA